MKTWFYYTWKCSITLLLLLLFVACEPYPRESKRIASAFEQAQLVYGEGENDTLLFIPELDKTASYFVRKNDYGKAALSALYYGYSEMNYDRAVAMNAFMDAEHYGDLVHDSLTVARAQYQMGKLLFYDYMKREALSMFKKSEVYFGHHYSEKALTMNAEACAYILLHEYDSAGMCLKNSLFWAELGGSDEAIQKVLNNYAKLYQIQGKYGKAVDYLRMMKPTNNQQTILNWLNFGNIFMAMGEMDSASYYFNQTKAILFEANIKDETMASAYNSLSQFAELQGDFAKALEYQKNDKQYLIKVKDRIEKEGVFRIQQQYDFEKMKNEMSGKVIIRQRIILLLSMIVLLVCIILFLLQKRLVKIQKQEIEAKERTLFYIRQYTDLLKQKGKTMQKVAILMDNKEDKALLDSLRATVFGNKDSWDALMEVFDTLHPGERQHIHQKYPELSEMEQKDIILSYFKVSRQDEALWLKTSVHTIDKIRTSLKELRQEIAEKQKKNL